VRKSAL
jgi:hypothetical protein